MNNVQLATAVAGESFGDDVDFLGVSIDSRTVKENQLFIALQGPTFDGHDYVHEAYRKGAAVALVSRYIDCEVTQVLVEEVGQALIDYAAWHRQQFNLDVIAITGSCGKTSTRVLLQSVLSQHGDVLATEGNLNNHIGVPLTLLRLTEQHQFAVIEIGASAAGEIKLLTAMVQPNIAIVTNAALAHIEGFGSLENVAKTKGELYAGLSKDGLAIINADEHYSSYWRDLLAEQKVIDYSLQVSTTADFKAAEIQLNQFGHAQFELHSFGINFPVELGLLGLHQVSNAVAVVAAALSLGVAAKNIQIGLKEAVAERSRMKVIRLDNGVEIIDDAYNANPRSVRAAVDFLASHAGPTCFVFGDMLELGEEAEKYHAQIGEYARMAGIDEFYAVGNLSKAAVKQFGPGAYHFDDRDELVGNMESYLDAGSKVLVKGSASMKMQDIVGKLKQSQKQAIKE
jgi:UDP-N-acetylmuramoyl-tripeptide--D-alanyl-D-alanine ligase